MATPKSLNIVFAGTSAFAVPALKKLYQSPHKVIAVYTQPDRPAGRGLKMQPSPVKECALKFKLPIHQPVSLRDKTEQHCLADLQPDLMVVVSYGLILPKEILTIPPMGCVNIHPSLLPRFRGATPIQSAILAGDDQTGICIIQMNEQMDAGDILLQTAYALPSHITAGELHDELAATSGELLLDFIEKLLAGCCQPHPQNPAAATYCKKIAKEDALLDWNKPAIELDRQIRAYNPIPVAFTFLQQERIKIWRSSICKSVCSGNTGEIVELQPDGIIVATGNGYLKLLELQLAGGKRLSARELLKARAHLFAKGHYFTSQL